MLLCHFFEALQKYLLIYLLKLSSKVIFDTEARYQNTLRWIAPLRDIVSKVAKSLSPWDFPRGAPQTTDETLNPFLN